MSLIEKAMEKSRALRESQGRSGSVHIDLRKHAHPYAQGQLPDTASQLVGGGFSLGSARESVAVDFEELQAKRVCTHDASNPLSNLFSVLATQVTTAMNKSGFRTIAVVSPTSGAGKSTIVANLAISLAKRSNEYVLAVDLDLRKPSLAQMLSLSPDVGVERYLEGRAELSDVLYYFKDFERLALLPGAEAVSNVDEVLHSFRMTDFLDQCENEFGASRVIYDLPPLLGLSDALDLLPKFDCLLFVVEEGETTREQIEECKRLIGTTPLVGSIVNKGQSQNANVNTGAYSYFQAQ